VKESKPVENIETRKDRLGETWRNGKAKRPLRGKLAKKGGSKRESSSQAGKGKLGEGLKKVGGTSKKQ